METSLRHIINTDWITGVLILCLLLIAVAKYLHSTRFIDFLLILHNDKLIFNGRENPFRQPFMILLTIAQVGVFSTFVFLVYCTINQWVPSEKHVLFLQILAGYSLFFVLKALLEFVIHWILGLGELFNTYFPKKLSYRNFASLIVLVMCYLLVYSTSGNDIILYTTLGFLLLIFFISAINFFSNYRRYILSHPFYFILYFCALEIAPYYILYKITTV